MFGFGKRKWWIYSLSDPLTGDIRYIGFTSQGIDKRLKQHLADKKVSPKTEWIRELDRQGLKPVIEVLKESDGDDWGFYEQTYIRHYRRKFNLLNLTDGGKGGKGCTLSLRYATKPVICVQTGEKYKSFNDCADELMIPRDYLWNVGSPKNGVWHCMNGYTYKWID